MAWTTPRTWTIGEVVTKAIMDVHVRDNLQYLKDVLDGVQSQNIFPTYAAADALGLTLGLRKARGTIGSPALVTNGDILGNLNWRGHDGAAYQDAALIRAEVDGVAAANDMPGRLLFYTTTDGTITLTERLRIDNAGRFLQGTNYAYLGNYNSSTVHPRAGTDLATAWNFSGGGREMALWNTDTTPATTSFSFRQLTGASASLEIARLTTVEGVMALGGNASGDGFAFINDPNTMVTNPAADAIGILCGGNTQVNFSNSVTFYTIAGQWAEFVNTSIRASRASQAPLFVDRGTDDGTLISLRQDTVEEGTISVSTTTVSYNAFRGSHYTQLKAGQQEPARGALVVSLDELIPSECWVYLAPDGRRYSRRDAGIPGSDLWQAIPMPTKDAELYVGLSSTPNDPAVYGGWLGKLSDDSYGSSFGIDNQPVYQVTQVGKGELWVTDSGGNLAVGDLLTSSSRPGLAQRQADDIVHSYTIAKARKSVDWAAVTPATGIKKALIPVTFYA